MAALTKFQTVHFMKYFEWQWSLGSLYKIPNRLLWRGWHWL